MERSDIVRLTISRQAIRRGGSAKRRLCGGRKPKSPIAAATIVAHVAPDTFSAGLRPQLLATTPVGVQKNATVFR